LVEQIRPKYHVDLPNLMALCALNYARLHKLVPDLKQTHAQQSQVWLLRGEQQLQLTVLQNSRYTTELQLSLSPSAEVLWQQPFFLRVRVYHDAALAEVVSCNESGRLQAIYPYPNAKMQQRNEKHELNRFLAEWLSYSLQHGQRQASVVADFFSF